MVVLPAGRHYDADELLRLVERQRVTQMSIVGDAFARPVVAALEAAEAAGRPCDLSSLQRVVSTEEIRRSPAGNGDYQWAREVAGGVG